MTSLLAWLADTLLGPRLPPRLRPPRPWTPHPRHPPRHLPTETPLNLLSIDPGNTESAYTLLDLNTRRPLAIDKVPNHQLLDRLLDLHPDHVAIEMIASYGMPVGKEVFETCLWIGRYTQYAYDHLTGVPVELVYRREVKLHHCQSSKAKDPNVTQALVDRFAPGEANRGKGTKSQPGWFHGFAADIWQAYAVGVLAADRLDTTGHAAGF